MNQKYKMNLISEFEKDSGYRFENCDLCINEQCKSTQLCDYWKKYALWLEKKMFPLMQYPIQSTHICDKCNKEFIKYDDE